MPRADMTPREHGTAPGVPALLPLSAEDEALLDQAAVDFEGDRSTRDVERLNTFFEVEPRSPEWAATTEVELTRWITSMHKRYDGVRVGAPICKATICLLRAIAPLQFIQGGSGARLPEVPIHLPLWRDRFEGVGTYSDVRNGEAIFLTYLYRRCVIDRTC